MIKKSLYSIFVSALFIAASVVVFILIIRGVWVFTMDDAFIGFRYAKNFVSTGNIVWNIGEQPVEGYTSIIWIFLLAIPHLLHLDVVLFIKLAGIFFTVAYVVVLFIFTEELRKDLNININKIAGSLSVLLISVFPATAIYSVAGLETPLFLLFVVLFLYNVWLLTIRPSERVALATSIIAFLLGITRPDGNVIAILGILTALTLNPSLRNIRLTRHFLLYIIPGSIYFLWRYWYFGLLLPLPFYIKVAHSYLSGLPIVLEFVKFFMLRIGVPLLIGLSLVRKRHLSILIPIGVYFIFYIFPEHMMGQNFRFLSPVTLIMVLFISLGLIKIYESMDRKRIFFIPMVALVAILLAWYAPGNIRAKQEDGLGLLRAHKRLAKILKEIDPNGNSTLAFADAGAVPYYSGWRVIDTFGLNDPHIATTGDHSTEYLINQRVDMLIVASKKPEEFIPILKWDTSHYNIFINRGMEKLGMLQYDTGEYLWVIADPKSEIGEKFVKSYHNIDF